MDRRRIVRELAYLPGGSGRVVAGVLSEIGAIPVAAQDPARVAETLACARIVDDPESALAAPQAFSVMRDLLDQLHKGADDD